MLRVVRQETARSACCVGRRIQQPPAVQVGGRLHTLNPLLPGSYLHGCSTLPQHQERRLALAAGVVDAGPDQDLKERAGASNGNDRVRGRHQSRIAGLAQKADSTCHEPVGHGPMTAETGMMRTELRCSHVSR